MSHNSTIPSIEHTAEFTVGFCIVIFICCAIGYVGGASMGGILERFGLTVSPGTNAMDSSSATPFLDARGHEENNASLLVK